MAFEQTPLYAHCKNGLGNREDWLNILKRLSNLYADGECWANGDISNAFFWADLEEGHHYWDNLYIICLQAERNNRGN